MKASPADKIKGSYPKWPSTRFKLALLGFLGFNLVYAMRVNLSIAIVQMVEQPKHQQTHSQHLARENISPRHSNAPQLIIDVQEECPVRPQSESTNQISLLARSQENQKKTKTGKGSDANALPSTQKEKFSWTEQEVSAIMGAFYYGYMFTQILGGYLATMYGGKWVFSFGIFMASILTALTPWAAGQGPDVLWYTRFFMGLFEAVTFPAYTSMMGRWVPVFEKSLFGALALSGGVFGNVIAQIGMGYICSLDFMGGWPLGFYLIGFLGVIFVTYWNKTISSFPDEHPFIDPAELEFIKKNTQSQISSKGKLDWGKVATSVPMWAILAAHFGNTFIQYGMMTCLPQYLALVLNFDISQNGVLCALPWAFCFIVTQFVSVCTDKLREKRIVTTTRIRRINGLIGAVGPSLFLVLASYSGCNHVLAVACITIGLSFAGFTASAYNCNHLDLAPQYAGTLFGITNTFATMSGFLAPELATYFTAPNPRSRLLWQKYFYVSASVDVVGGLIYFFFASGELQSWALSSPVLPNKLDIAKV